MDIQTVAPLYSGILFSNKGNEVPSHENTLRNLKDILSDEQSLLKKATCSVIPTKWHSGKSKTVEKVKKQNQWFPGA